MLKLLKMYFNAIINAPKNIEKQIELNKKKEELINKKYEELKNEELKNK